MAYDLHHLHRAFGTSAAGAPADYEIRQAIGWTQLTSSWREIATTGEHNAIPKLTTSDTAVNLQVASTSATDDIANSGARSIWVTYLDSNMEEVAAEVDLDGTTPVNVNASAYGIVGAHVTDTGGAAGQVGVLGFGESGDFTSGSPGTYYGKIPLHVWTSGPQPGHRMRSCVVPVPANRRAAILSLRIFVENAAVISIDVKPKDPASTPPYSPARQLWSGLVSAPGPGHPIEFGVPFDFGGTSGLAPSLPAIDPESWITVSGIRQSTDGYCSALLTYALVRI